MIVKFVISRKNAKLPFFSFVCQREASLKQEVLRGVCVWIIYDRLLFE
jgi:hypothetical protein